MSRRIASVFLIAGWSLTCSVLAPPLPAAEETIWRIGRLDESSLEFKLDWERVEQQGGAVFTPGQSDPAADWPSRQPGSLNEATGARRYPYTILFSLSKPPAGTYRLLISVLLTRSRVPRLEIEINGKKGLFYFHRRASYYPGDFGFDSPIFGRGKLSVELPASAFHAGENRLVLTAVDDPEWGSGDSWLRYDGLRLEHDDAGELPGAPEVSVEPTAFYLRRGNELVELTDVTLRLGEAVRQGEIELAVSGKNYQRPLAQGYDFGEQRFEIPVAEFSGETEAEVTVRINGASHTSRIPISPQRKWTVYVAPNTHLDIGYTDYQAKVAEVHSRNLDRLLEEIDAHPEMRFSLDGSWIVEQYLASRGPAARRRVLDYIREGKIAVPAQFASVMTGYPTLEELIRSTDFSRLLHRKEDAPFEYANITDVPSYTWSYPSVLAALGIKYFSAAANSDRGPILLYGKWNEKSPFWWRGPDGAKVLMSYSRQYFQFSFICGIPASEGACRESLPTFLQQYDAPSYQPDVVLMYGSQIENTDLIPGEPEFIARWNSKYAYPKMLLKTFPDYMRYIDEHFGSQLATVTGDGGPYWEDGYGTDAHYLAIDRASQHRATSAEKLATIAAHLVKNVSGPAAEIRAMWDELLLYSEHTFTFWGAYSRPESEQSVRQLTYKDNHARNSRQHVNAVLDQSFAQLAYEIPVPARAIVVFNSLNWARAGLVEIDLDAGYMIVSEPDNAPVPLEVLAHHHDYDHIRFFARGVPSLGYRVYRVVRKTGQSAAPADETPLPVTNLIENDYYRIEVNPSAGAIRSIYDKQLQRNIVNTASGYGFNQYLYVAGGDGSTQIVYLRKAFPFAKLTVEAAGGGRVKSLRKTPYGQVLSYETSGSHAPRIETEIILYDTEKKIELINRFHKEPSENKEAIYFAFPVAASRPRFSYEIQNGWVDPARDALRGANPAWFTVQHWVKVSSPELSVALTPVDAPLVTLGDINRGRWPDKFEPAGSTIFSYALNNYWHTNFRRVQSGDYTFRYVLTSGAKLSPEHLTRLGRAAMTPLERGELLSTDKRGNPPRTLTTTPTSFLAVDAADVVVVNWKAADDGDGTIVRLLETGGRATKAHLRFPIFPLRKAWLASAAERNLQPLTVDGKPIELTLKPHQIATVRVVTGEIR